MIKKEAVVTQVKDGKVSVRVVRDSMCGCCSNMFCGVKKQNDITVEDPIGLKQGDRVEIGLDTRVSLMLSMLLFLVPCVVLVGGIYLFKNAGAFLSFLASLVIVSVYFIIVRFTVINKLKERLSCRIIGRAL